MDAYLYRERVTSRRTTALFVALTALFLLLSVWRVMVNGMGALPIALLCLSCFFAFYTLNYRALIVRVTPQSLTLTFGLFTWTVPLDEIAGCAQDDVSLWRIGGAGIHFTGIRGRYRAMFNVLEYPRVVVALRHRRGPVRDIAFSTRRPDAVMSIITKLSTAHCT